MSGSEGSGKSGLLAWLVHHGSQRETAAERAVHAVTPGAGRSLRGTVWSLAEQLGVVARDPEDLVAMLSRDQRRTVIVLPDLHEGESAQLVLDLARLPHLRIIVESRSGSLAHRRLALSGCAELDLDLEVWRDQARFEQWQTSLPEAEGSTVPRGADPVVDLSDPVAVCAADPWQVTAAYEGDSDSDHGGLRAAWLRAGQSLCREQSSASRAVSLLCVLGDSADPRLAPALAQVAAEADWSVEWSRVRGDMAPPWPGAVTSLARGAGPLAGRLLMTGPGGLVKALSVADASSCGRLPHGRREPVDMTVMADGTVLLLDESGHVHAESSWAVRPAGSGIARLLDDGPTDVQRLLSAVQECAGTALASAAGPDLGIVAVGDSTGTVRTIGDVAGSEPLHRGPVTALAVLSVPADSEASMPVVYSGGADGVVRAWGAGHAPMSAPVVQRSCPVVCLDAALTASGPSLVVAWDDGVVQWIQWETGTQQTLRPGPPVRAVALDRDGRVFIGMDEALTCLIPRQASTGSDPSTV
ncbi:hypothetical protein [Streptomyces sp. CA-251247]|uniref:hypothetical protein n=1 Tax=Streptomyces sp. CA-251247 TaxID=3240062 RepID=UPI003D8E2C8D